MGVTFTNFQTTGTYTVNQDCWEMIESGFVSTFIWIYPQWSNERNYHLAAFQYLKKGAYMKASFQCIEVGWIWKPALEKDVPAHAWVDEIRWSLRTLPTQIILWVCDSMISIQIHNYRLRTRQQMFKNNPAKYSNFSSIEFFWFFLELNS